VHGESGDDFVYGGKGNDRIYGDGQDDDLIGTGVNDWISGGTGNDGVIGDDGRIFTSRTARSTASRSTASPRCWPPTDTSFSNGNVLNEFIYTPETPDPNINIADELRNQ